jgi:hypothetical protein
MTIVQSVLNLLQMRHLLRPFYWHDWISRKNCSSLKFYENDHSESLSTYNMIMGSENNLLVEVGILINFMMRLSFGIFVIVQWRLEALALSHQ